MTESKPQQDHVVTGVIDHGEIATFALDQMQRFIVQNNGKSISTILEEMEAYVITLREAVEAADLNIIAASFAANIAPLVGRALFMVSIGSSVVGEAYAPIQAAGSATKH